MVILSCSKLEKNEFALWMESEDKLKVLSTTAMIDSLVKKIGGNHVSSLVLIKGDLDPHSYEMVKGDGEKIDIADIVFYNGLGLEHAPSLIYKLHNSSKAVALGDKIKDAEPDEIIYVDGQVDPHVWMDISLWQKAVPLILEQMVQGDPKNTVEYEKNAKNLLEDMQKSHAEVHEILQSIPPQKRYLVTGHDGFHYFVRAYFSESDERNKQTWFERFQAPEGLAPQAQISMIDLREVLDFVAKHKIEVLFPESNLNNDSIIKMISAGREMGLNIRLAKAALYSDALGAKGSGAEEYLDMLLHNAKTISEHLKERF